MTEQERLEESKRLYTTANADQKYVLERLFPELQESEDERIRKWIVDELKDSLHCIEALYSRDYDNRDKDDIIREDFLRKALAWFEKQGDNKPSETTDLRTWKYIVDAVLTERGGIGQYIDSPWTTEVAKKLQKRFGSIEQKHVEPQQDMLSQEQYAKAVDECIYGEQKPAEFQSEKELVESYLAVFDKKYPILPTLKGKQLANFKNFLNKCQQEFGLKEYGIHPTQAKLFGKLALLWATWGAEHLQGIGKSEIEDKPAWSEEDEKLQSKLIRWQEEWLSSQKNGGYMDNGNLIKSIEESISWLHHIKDRVQPQPKQEWKQENTDDLTDFENAMMHIGGSFFGENAGLDPNDTNTIKEQANLLLELVPKQEWSEEDEIALGDALWCCKQAASIAKDENDMGNVWYAERWLKSLRPQKQWKPSEEQLESLKLALYGEAFKLDELQKLYEQLKALV